MTAVPKGVRSQDEHGFDVMGRLAGITRVVDDVSARMKRSQLEGATLPAASERVPPEGMVDREHAKSFATLQNISHLQACRLLARYGSDPERLEAALQRLKEGR